MWNSASPDIKNAYTKSYVMSWLNKPMVHGWTTKSRDIRPVSKAVEHALCSGSPRERYLVGGVGTILAFIDELAVSYYSNKKGNIFYFQFNIFSRGKKKTF